MPTVTDVMPRTGRMATKIFHPNVSSAGEICVNTLKKDWKPTYGVEHILTTIKCLLIFPNPESALDEEAGKLLLEDYDEYCARARIVTSVHAKVRPAEFADAEVPPEAPSAPPAASSSKAILPPSISLASAPPPITPHAPRIPSSSHLHGGSTENEPSAGTVLLLKTLGKDSRHPSPAPLGLGGNVGFGTDSPLANTITGVVVGPLAKATKPVKAVKRTAASPPVVTNAEKRKKALKRL
jgi:ubiquitin-conjugating enzyme E2 S